MSFHYLSYESYIKDQILIRTLDVYYILSFAGVQQREGSDIMIMTLVLVFLFVCAFVQLLSSMAA